MNAYDITKDPKIPIERRQKWEEFNKKYPPKGNNPMGRMIDYDYKHQPDTPQEGAREWWRVIRDNRDDFKYPPVVPTKPTPVVKEEKTKVEQGFVDETLPWNDRKYQWLKWKAFAYTPADTRPHHRPYVFVVEKTNEWYEKNYEHIAA